MTEKIINIEFLKSFWKVINKSSNKNRVWVFADFIGNYQSIKSCFNLFVFLGLIEKVKVSYRTGRKSSLILETEGYKLS